jgi:hypothetical protein
LSSVRCEFFVAPEHRLTEQERALMTAMLHRLIEDVAVEIQARLPEEWLPANEDHNALIDRLSECGLLDIGELMAILLRRADEARINAAFQARPDARHSSIVQPLVSGGDADVASAAMAVLIARGRRRDRFGRVLIELDDLSAECAATFVHAVAATLSERKSVHVATTEAQQALCKAAQAVLHRHDPAKSVDRLTAVLVRILDQQGQLDDSWLRAAADNAEIGLLTHMLARRAGLDPLIAAGELASSDPRRIMLFLRLSGASRQFAAHFVAVLGDSLRLGTDLHALAIFDSFSEDRLAAASGWLGLDHQFKSALQALGHGHGPV